MAVLLTEIRRGAYHDSIVLMQLQSALAELPGIEDAGVVMATAANLELLEASRLKPEFESAPAADDLVIVVRTESETAGRSALGEIDRLLARRSSGGERDFRPHSLDSAFKLAPEANWVLVSVPGRYAADVAREAIRADRHVFLYSDNVSLEDELELKRTAAARGRMVMGADCGTAIVDGVGFGFANRVERGPIGLIGASGTGLQAITAGIHARGSGVSHALGTGGRDLSEEIGAITARQSLALLAGDPETEVIVLVSKPPAPRVATPLLAAAGRCGKPVVVSFVGYAPPGRRRGGLHFAGGLDDAASLAVELLEHPPEPDDERTASRATGPHLRALFAGGTLAYEAQQVLRSRLSPLHSNAPILDTRPVVDVATSSGHTILDLGADEFTVGRPHPMIDQDLRLRRLRQEASDPDAGAILLDLVLGDGAHPDPAAELAPAIAEIRRERGLPVFVMIVGTDRDPQDLDAQRGALEAAGAEVFTEAGSALDAVLQAFAGSAEAAPAVDPGALRPSGAVNVGIEIFSHSLGEQGVANVQVDWRPPAGGDERLAAILAKMK